MVFDFRDSAQVIVKEQQYFVCLLGIGTDGQFHVDLQCAFIRFGHVLGAHDA